MTRSPYHTVTRRTRTGWRAIRMFGDEELYHEDAETWSEARTKLRRRMIPEIAAKAFDRRNTPEDGLL